MFYWWYKKQFCASKLFQYLNCDEVSNNALDDEINIFNSKYNNKTWTIENVLQNPHRPPVVVNNSPQNKHDFNRLKTVPIENSNSFLVKDHKGKENNIVIFSNFLPNLIQGVIQKFLGGSAKKRVAISVGGSRAGPWWGFWGQSPWKTLIFTVKKTPDALISSSI